MNVAILTVSDRCSLGEQEDKSGPVLAEMARSRGWTVRAGAIVPDEAERIRAQLVEWVDQIHWDVVLITGGTGVGPRDVTPEAALPLFDKELPGFGELMRLEGRRATPLAFLSRGTAGVRKNSVIVLLPGSPKGASESFAAVAELIPHVHHIVRGGAHSPPVGSAAVS